MPYYDIPGMPQAPDPRNWLNVSQVYDPFAGMSMAMKVADFQDKQRDANLRRRLDELYIQEAQRKEKLNLQTEQFGEEFIKSLTAPTAPPSGAGMRSALPGGAGPGMPLQPNALAPGAPSLASGPTQARPAIPSAGGPIPANLAQRFPNQALPLILEERKRQQKLQEDAAQKQVDSAEQSMATAFGSGDSERARGSAQFYSGSSNPKVAARAKEALDSTKFLSSGDFTQDKYFSPSELNNIRTTLPPEKQNLVPTTEGYYHRAMAKGKLTFEPKHATDDILLSLGGDVNKPEQQSWVKQQIANRASLKEQLEGPVPFKTFYRGQEEKLKKEHPEWTKGRRDEEIDKQWNTRQEEQKKTLIEIRYPPMTQASKLPPWIMFDRRRGYVNSENGEKVSREELSKAYGQMAVMEADKRVYSDIDRRLGLVESFTREIDIQIPILKRVATTLGNTDPKYLNWPRNKIRQFMGEGEWNSYLFAINSISALMAKAETNQLGIGAPPVDQLTVMRRIHDENLSINDLMKVVNTGKDFGQAHVKSLKQQLDSIGQKIPSGETPSQYEKGLIKEETPSSEEAKRVRPPLASFERAR